ncbi:MAG: response regulator transcription factor [Proteobacteria bacterium]|nr:response regulator transcription factor [Pseudomonadota bacterium]
MLSHSGHACDSDNCTIERALDWIKTYDYDLIVIGKPNADWSRADMVRELRKAGYKSSVIVLGVETEAKDYVRNMLNCFDAGADDYMGSPVEPVVLMARIIAVVRRTLGHASPLIRVGELVLDLHDCKISCKSGDLRLSAAEYRLLSTLMVHNKSSFVAHERLAVMCGGLHGGHSNAVIKVQISQIRAKLKRAGVKDGDIFNVWGRGYQVRGGKDE